MSGNIYDFDLRGRAAGENIVVARQLVRRFRANTHGRTRGRRSRSSPSALDAGGVSAMGFAFDTVNVRVTYASPGGHVELAVTPGDNRQYAAKGDYAL